jgi:hypothetical protein
VDNDWLFKPFEFKRYGRSWLRRGIASGEMQKIDDLYAAAKMYAVAALEIVNRKG